jgi:hypothetical protein
MMVTWALFMGITISKCANGCLKCNTNDECLFCDPFNGFYSSQYGCLQKSIQFCEMLSSDGSCALCNHGYVMDGSSGQCTKSTAVHKTSNCVQYNPYGVCVKCEASFGLVADKCLNIPSTIPNCQVYLFDGLCSSCEDGYEPSFDFRSCKKIIPIKNCIRYSFVGCHRCKSGFIMNENLGLKHFNKRPEVNQLLDSIKMTNSGSIEKKVCQKVKIEGCEEALSSTRCKKCANGYFLSTVDYKCEPNTAESIKGCQFYKYIGVCVECGPNLFLKDSSTCMPVVPIDNCDEYDGSKNSSTCKKCIKNFFLNSSTGTCVASKYPSIANCLHFEKTADGCKTCKLGFVKSESGDKCLPGVKNCSSYLTTSQNGGRALCLNCQDGFYRSGGICRPGTVEFCQNYDIHTDICKKCQEGFYLLPSGRCHRHEEIEFCRKYSDTPNSCSECDSQSILFNYKRGCIPGTSIVNCEKYLDINRCEKCAKGFYPSPISGSGCLLVPESVGFCEKFNGETLKCEVCTEGFMLSSKGGCHPPFQYISSACANDSLVSTKLKERNVIGCEKCSEFTISISSSNLAMCYPSYHLQFLGIENLVRRCIRYRGAACIECEYGYRLRVDNTCGVCNSELESALLVEFDSSKVNICKVEGPKGCSQHVILPNTGLHCTHIQTNFLAKITSFDQVSPYPLNNSSVRPGLLSHNAPLIEPVEIIKPRLIHVSHCLYYLEHDNKIKCLRCNHGYTGVIDDNGFIKTCEPMVDCDVPIERGGLPGYLTGFVSCHACRDKKKIPMIVVEGPHLGDWFSFQKTEKNSVACKEPETFIDFHGDNCAMGADILLLGDNINISICVACSPGYIPTYNNRKVTSCARINNCSLTNLSAFNICPECQISNLTDSTNNYAWLFNTNNDFDLAFCVQTSTANCLFSTLHGICVHCRPGYIMNSLGTCQKLVIADCEDESSSPYLSLRMDDYKLYFLFLHLTTPGGCSRCKSPNHAVELSKGLDFCMAEVSSGRLTISEKLISNCSIYMNDSKTIRCAQCRSGFIPSLDKLSCFYGLPGCSHAKSDDPGFCAICEPQYANIMGMCRSDVLAGCQKYEQTIFKSLDDAKCQSCLQGFYVMAGVGCHPGSILGCMKYSQKLLNVCEECKPHYTLLSVADSKTVCLKTKGVDKCEELEPLSFQKGILDCKHCRGDSISPFVATEDISLLAVRSICLLLPVINGCKKYDISTKLQDSSFKCIECQYDYLLNQQSLCSKREMMDQNCQSYSITSDECKTCASNYALTPDRTGCRAMLIGIANCSKYASKNSCAICNSRYYLKSGACIPVEKIILHCDVFIDARNCQFCERLFVLENKKCVPGEALNCLEFASRYACATCPPGKGLFREGKLINCNSVESENCVEYETDKPYRCLKCKEGFYPNDKGSCSQVLVLITDCVTYKSASVCGKCHPQRLLSADGSECFGGSEVVDVLEENCDESFYSETGLCAQCAEGYYLKEGKCVECSKELSNRGCLTCDPVNQDYCPICSPSHYMNKTQQCNLVEGLNITAIYEYISEKSENESVSSYMLLSPLALIFTNILLSLIS